MPEFGKTITSQKHVIPLERGQIEFFWRHYIEVDGETCEMIRVFDCEAHYEIREKKLDICLAEDKIKPIEQRHLRPCGQTDVCIRNCPFKKERAEKKLAEHGQWLSEEVKQYLQKIIESEDV